MALRFAFLATVAISALCGCGGGSSGSSSSNQSSGTGGSGSTSAALVVAPGQVNATALTTDPAPTALVQVGVQVSSNAGTQTQFYIKGSNTQNGIQSVSAAADGPYDDITITFKVPASLGPGTYTDTLTIEGCFDQACTDQVSNSPQMVPVTYTITQPQAQVISISPTSTSAGAVPFTLTVNGSAFLPQSVVLWNGSALATTFVSASQLTAQVPASDVITAGNYSVTVSNGSGAVSSAATFTVTSIPMLALTRISPSQVIAGGPSFNLTAIGTGFTATSSISWNGASVPTTYVSSTILQAQVTAAQIASTGSVSIMVVDSASHASTSSLNLTIAAASVDAVTYQMNAAHTGAVTFKTVALPTSSAWSVDVGGSASYALIVGGQVFVTIAIDGNSELLALNATTGATIWGPIEFTGPVNAAYDGGQVFVVSGNTNIQTLSALSAATGRLVWTATVPGDLNPLPPVATDGIVYTNNGGTVAAFDETSGTILWQAYVAGTSGIVAVTADGLYASAPCSGIDLQPAVGSQIWSYNSGCSGGGGATPVAANGLIYAPTNAGTTIGAILDAETGATKGNYSTTVIPAFSSSAGYFLYNGTLQGLTQQNNEVLWSFTGDGQLGTPPILVNNYVFIGSKSGNLYALDATSGQQLWNQNLGAAIPAFNEAEGVIYTGLAAGDGLLVVPNGTKVTAFVLSTTP